MNAHSPGDRLPETRSVPVQRTLAPSQVEEFYHDNFVSTQTADFAALVPSPAGLVVLDVGGGVGYFAEALSRQLGCRTRVLDADPVSVEACRQRGLDATIGDALVPQLVGDEQVVCFNMILHHLIGRGEVDTEQLQKQALTVWRRPGVLLFVNEYIYDSMVGDVSGRLIFGITRSRILSAIGRAVSRFVPSLRANTFGVGVRFRSRAAWLKLFEGAGLRVVAERRGADEDISLPRRLLMMRSHRRDSFLLAYDPQRNGAARGPL